MYQSQVNDAMSKYKLEYTEWYEALTAEEQKVGISTSLSLYAVRISQIHSQKITFINLSVSLSPCLSVSLSCLSFLVVVS